MDSYIKGNNNGSYEKINSTNGSLDANITNIPSVQVINAPNVSNILNQVDVNVNNSPNITSIINDVNVKISDTINTSANIYGEYTYVTGGPIVQVGTVNVPPSLHKEDNTEYNYSEYILKSQINNWPTSQTIDGSITVSNQPQDYSDNYLALTGSSFNLNCDRILLAGQYCSLSYNSALTSVINIWSTVTSQVNIVSTSANDTSGGSHARTIKIEGIDGSLNAVSETITLNGTTTVNSTLWFYRVNRATVETWGSYIQNGGDITVTDSGGRQVSFIEADRGASMEPYWTCPAGKTAVVKHINITHNCTNGDLDIQVNKYHLNKAKRAVYRLSNLNSNVDMACNLVINASECIMFIGRNTSGSVSYDVSAVADIYYI